MSLPIAARLCPRLVVVTSDETHGRRARLARHMLDLMDLPDVPVVQGVDLGGHHRFLLDDELPARNGRSFPEIDELVGMLEDAVAAGPVVWVGQGPMSELAAALVRAPHLAESIRVTQMGTWLDHYRNKSRASHNIDTDQKAANIALRLAHQPQLVLSDHTNVDEIAIGPDSILYKWLTAPGAPAWAQLVGANMTAWWAWQRKRNAPALTRMHDPLTLSAALDLSFVTFQPQRIRMIADGRIHRDPHGREVLVSTGVAYGEFDDWLHEMVCVA
ncbi:nucleoside hydrolase [Nocardia wallacei]|uniref:nucleoside hydrolase n=1 Tax=Nocardia wallacei TaxID=480035 RepID=UPI002453E6A6|nr:nucleoside hydrolase [Nocardia wallacei]